MNYYPADIRQMPDDELIRLQKEIEDSGILAYDCYDWPDDSWQRQAHDRWWDILHEMRGRHPEPPTGVPLKELNEYTAKYINSKLVDSLFCNDHIFRALRGR